MIPQDILSEASRHVLAKGLRLLQGFRLADTDAAHIAALLDFMQPQPWTHWLDIGSGFGEAARLMRAQHPDLRFTLVNNNESQIEHTPSNLTVHAADMHALPFEDAMFDGCMFLWSLCHADDQLAALKEAARVTKPNGVLFVFDFAREHGDDDLFQRNCYATAVPFGQTWHTARAAGWDVQACCRPAGSDAVFRALAQDDALIDAMMDGVHPVLWRARRLDSDV